MGAKEASKLLLLSRAAEEVALWGTARERRADTHEEYRDVPLKYRSQLPRALLTLPKRITRHHNGKPGPVETSEPLDLPVGSRARAVTRALAYHQ